MHGFWGSKGREGPCNALRDGVELSLTRSLGIFRDQQNSLLARVQSVPLPRTCIWVYHRLRPGSLAHFRVVED